MRFASIFFLVLCLISSTVLADAKDDQFAKSIELTPLQMMSVQHRQTIKTFDSFARQTISEITGRQSLDGKPAAYSVLDICIAPEKYIDRNIIRIKNVPLRKDFRLLSSIDEAEKDRILHEGTISLKFWLQNDVRQLLMQQQSTQAFKFNAINDVARAANSLADLVTVGPGFPMVAFIPPPPGNPKDRKWKLLTEIAGNNPALVSLMKERGANPPAAMAGYEKVNFEPIFKATADLLDGWSKRDSGSVTIALAQLVAFVRNVNFDVYPSIPKRTTELWYNRLAKLTIPGAALYFIAFVFFLVSTRSGINSLRLWGLRVMMLAFAVHTLGIGVRWWLVAETHGNWFDGIPIKNQFESVLFSAWFGGLVGLILELRRSRGIFGAAASFVGWLSLTAIFATPYVTGKEIGGEIGQVNGVLMSYWLYIHVTMVVASYALIGMGFALGVWWLVRYYRHYNTVGRVSSRLLSAEGLPRSEREDYIVPAGGGGAAINAGFLSTLLRVAFFPQQRHAAVVHSATASAKDEANEQFLARLDLCNLVVLQLGFWVLGAGIVLGAIWADMSWGRPWGWDPKETFALVTWIVYLIVVHVRVVTADKAWWTAVLSILGFFVMLFNWIGVNFFLVGLHSYA